MAYARRGEDSDVHVFATGPHRWECCNCSLDVKDFVAQQPEQMIEHLRLHLVSGHKVPDFAFLRLLGDWLGDNECDAPVVLFRGGYDDPAEPAAIAEHFPMVTNRSAVPRSSLVVGRYSVLPFYKELCADLEEKGSRLINSYSQHRYLADLGNWYRDLRGLTPETWNHMDQVPADAWPCVLKGETNSVKFQWRHKMYAEDRDAGIAVQERLLEDGVVGEQSIYIRKFVPLRRVQVEDIGCSGPPISREFRFFVCDGQVICSAFYWSVFDEDELDEPYPRAGEVPREFMQQVIERVGANARFYVVDVAQTEAGDWIVIELNDGQMSGLSDNDPHELYGKLRQVLRPDEDKAPRATSWKLPWPSWKGE
jgi:ATP-grasp domain, R2K clade family 3